MDTQAPATNAANSTETKTQAAANIQPDGTFAPGSLLIYGMHGKCSVISIEIREISGESIRFYKLEIQKSALSRSTRQEPAIWVPVNSAFERGLRPPINKEQGNEVVKILGTREYYFPLTESWSAIQPKLEACIRNEGAIGLAKVESYLHVLKHRQIVPSPEVNRLSENVHKLLFRELSEATGESIRALEEKVARGMRQKLLADN